VTDRKPSPALAAMALETGQLHRRERGDVADRIAAERDPPHVHITGVQSGNSLRQTNHLARLVPPIRRAVQLALVNPNRTADPG
jgi:hypothetical protein